MKNAVTGTVRALGKEAAGSGGERGTSAVVEPAWVEAVINRLAVDFSRENVKLS